MDANSTAFFMWVGGSEGRLFSSLGECSIKLNNSGGQREVSSQPKNQKKNLNFFTAFLKIPNKY